MNRLMAGGVVALLISLLSGCVSDSGQSSTSIVEASCTEPPLNELEASSHVVLTVVPNPVAAGSEATLSVSSGDLPVGVFVGAGAAWQCWNGSRWVDTHQIVRGFASDPVTLAVEPGDTTTIPAIGLPIPNSYPILIPVVPRGFYRIEDSVGGITGFVIVEVR